MVYLVIMVSSKVTLWVGSEVISTACMTPVLMVRWSSWQHVHVISKQVISGRGHKANC